MSEFHVEVVRIGPIEKHPNADTLGITRIHGGYPVIVKLGQYTEGQLAVYVPVDAVVPADDPRWEFLKGHCRIHAKRLRGVFSMGLLTEAPSLAVLGADVADLLRITKWEQASPTHEDDADPPPVHVPVYTDIEGLRRWPDIFRPGEEVIITEKLHGESLRAVLVGDQLHVSSRIRWKIRGGKGNFWRAAEAVKLQEQLGHRFAVYGESHGSVGGFPYGARGGAPLRLFDAWDLAEQRYLDYDEFLAMSFRPDMMAPMLYRGPWDPAAAALLAEGPSTLDPSHVREGIVVRPVHERWDERIGRVILKLHGEGFLLKA